MTADIKRQLAAHGAGLTPARTSGRGTADKPASAKKSTKKDHSDELTNPQIQAARRAVVGVGRLAWTSTTFGVGMPCRKYLLADEGQAAELDSHFFRITGTGPTRTMSQKPQWTVEILAQGDPARLSLGIDWGTTLAEPAELWVPLDIMRQGPERIAGYFIELCMERAAMRDQLPEGVTFEDGIN